MKTSAPPPALAVHGLTVHGALADLSSDGEGGLSQEEAALRLLRHGPNTLPEHPGKPAWLRFLSQFNQALIYILLAAGAITAALGEWVDSGVIFGVVLINAVVGYIQEAKAENALAALKRLLATSARVVRQDQKLTLPAAELVPGDIVLLDAGDKVPADLRLIRVHELQVDEAMLTGESLPVGKQTHALPLETPLAERINMAFSGTLVTRGQGTGLVVATGAATETGRISSLVAAAPDLSTPFTRKVARMSQVLLYIILALAALTFGVGMLRGEPAFDMFMAAVAMAVGAIPEGLPAAVTVVLAIGVKRMAARRAIVRKLPAVETLGGVTVICSDKTGTLTQNQMTVERIWAGGREYNVTGVGYTPEGQILEAGAPTVLAGALRETLLAGLLCNDATLRQETAGWQVVGDPTEGALITAALKAGLGADHVQAHPRWGVLPFESERQYMATAHHRGPERLVYLKGAPERLLERCELWLDAAGREQALTAEARQAVEGAAQAMAGRGLRVLALACKGHSGEAGDGLGHHHVKGGLVFLGLQGMMDPPRPEARRAVAACMEAGVKVKMITGDHALTAQAIAAALGMPRVERVYTGRDLAAMDDGAFAEAAQACDVFARVEPEQKLRLVQALQAAGHVVAMTGDGVNDAPALKAADIGVAMGRGGTETAREAADMVLTDDNFATLVAAVEEGRGVFDNLTKFVVWTLPTNFGEGLVLTTAIILGVALPMTPLQILWINMTTAVLLGLMLAFEPIEGGVMARPPRHPEAALLTRRLGLRVLLVGVAMVLGAFGLFQWKLAEGGSLDAARTMAVNVFVAAETFYLFNCRSMTQPVWRLPWMGNPWIWFGVASMALLQLGFTYLPEMQRVFHSTPMDGFDWLLIVSVGLTVALLVSLEKWLLDRPSPGQSAAHHPPLPPPRSQP
ncbi:MAG: cation-transporting P-type ATPase [Pseudomonadota bacterium]